MTAQTSEAPRSCEPKKSRPLETRMNHAFYSEASHKHTQKSPFRESIVLKITDD